MERKVYYEHELRFKNGKRNWKSLIDKDISFVYDGIIGTFKIINIYTIQNNSQVVELNYNDTKFAISLKSFKNAQLRGVVVEEESYWRGLKQGDIVADNTRSFLLSERKIVYRNGSVERGYFVKCTECGATSYKSVYAILSGSRCKMARCRTHNFIN